MGHRPQPLLRSIKGATCCGLGCAAAVFGVAGCGSGHTPQSFRHPLHAANGGRLPQPARSAGSRPQSPPSGTALCPDQQPGTMMDFEGEPPSHDPQKLGFHGGPVQQHPAVYTISLSDGTRSSMRTISDVNSMICSLPGTSWDKMLKQVVGAAGADIQLAGTWSDRDPAPNVRREINRAITKNGWHPTSNSQFMIILPRGGKPDLPGAYGYHWVVDGHPFSVIQDNDSLTLTASHELAETITDPKRNAWYGLSDGQEMADICDDKGVIMRDAALNPYLLSGLLDVRTGRCGPPGVYGVR